MKKDMKKGTMKALVVVGIIGIVMTIDNIEAATVDTAFKDGDRSPTLEECETVGKLALAIMMYRQQGFPKRDIYDDVKDNQFAVFLIHQAWSTPLTFDEDEKAKISADFATFHYKVCWDQINKA